MLDMIRLSKFSFRFAGQVLNSKLLLKQEIEDILSNPSFALFSEENFRFLKILMSSNSQTYLNSALINLRVQRCQKVITLRAKHNALGAPCCLKSQCISLVKEPVS